MLNLETLARQHKEISEIVTHIKQMIHNNIDKNALDIAKQINMLAGKLKVHLATEDKYMYPYLLQSDSHIVRETAQIYADEMGHINNEFTNYKNKFNTRTKIINNTKEFLNETDRIFKILEERISKEDISLYKYI